MLNDEQYLLICLMEECDEVSQRASKALRFGLAEQQEGQEPNWARLFGELSDLQTITKMLSERGAFPMPVVCDTKRAKVAKYMLYSREQGILEPQSPRYRHLRRGSEYREIGRAKVQASTRPIQEGDEVVVYRSTSQNPQLFARRDEEFFDGRFAVQP